MDVASTFNEKLMDWKSGNPFPYVDPPRGWKPSFIIDAELYLRWFEGLFKSTIGQGYLISFIVGDPGAGKSHFKCHLDYLFNVAGSFNGLYSTFSAGQSKIASRDLWMDFFLNNDVSEKIKEMLPLETIEKCDLRSNRVKKNILDYVKGTLQIDALTENEIQAVAAGVSELLAKKNAGICMVIDNVDEYFRYLFTLREPLENLPEEERKSRRRQQELNDLQNFFGMLRTACRDMQSLLLLVACTTPIYNIIRGHAVTVDRTLAGRIQYQSEVLETLSLSQTFELVNKYLEWWCENNNVSLPQIEGCIVQNSEGDRVPIYPFSKSAIEEVHEVTGRYARDVKMICSECINNMKIEQRTWIVKDEYLAIAIEEAQKRRPQIIPEQNIASFKKRRAKWMKETMKIKLEKTEGLAKKRYSFGVAQDRLMEKLNTYVSTLGLMTEIPSSIQNWENLARWIDPQTLRIWKYGKEKRILVSHIFSDDPPLGKTYFRHIEWRDISDAISYVDGGLATHVLFVTHWCGGYSKSTLQYYHKTSWYDPVIDDLSLDDVLFKMIGAVEAEDSDERRDLVGHVDAYHLRLRETLDRLVAKTKPKYRPSHKNRKEVGFF